MSSTLKRKAIIASFLVGGFFLLGVVSMALGDRAAAQHFGAFAGVCAGQPHAGGTGHKLAVFSRESATAPWQADGNTLAGDRLATSAAEVGAVVCIDADTQENIGACAFRSGIGVAVLGVSVASVATGDVTQYPRVQHKRSIRVLAPGTAKPLATGEVRARAPRECNENVGKPSAAQFDGEPVSDSDVAAWVGGHVTP